MDSSTQKRWGILQHYDKVAEELNSAQVAAMADSLLKLKNRPKKSLSVNGLSDLSIRAGRSLFIDISGLGVSGWYIVDECTHDLIKETMTLKVVIDPGDLPVGRHPHPLHRPGAWGQLNKHQKSDGLLGPSLF